MAGVYWQPVGKGELVIAVGQELEYREELVNKMVFSQTGDLGLLDYQYSYWSLLL